MAKMWRNWTHTLLLEKENATIIMEKVWHYLKLNMLTNNSIPRYLPGKLKFVSNQQPVNEYS